MANSLKDLVSSVDWSKMLSGQDARNALIGSALGGLMLGGAGMMAKRDPEESKYAPVGDALVGALLGGVAGYGIPKGLALFRDSGRLAPDDDRMSYNNLGWGLGGAAAGVGAVGLGLRKTLLRSAGHLRNVAVANRASGLANAQALYDESVRAGDPLDIQKDRWRRLQMHKGTEKEVDMMFAGLRRRMLTHLKNRRFDEASVIRYQLSQLRALRKQLTRGYDSFGSLLRRVGDVGDALPRYQGGTGAFDVLLHPKQWFRNWTSAGHYRTGPLLGGVTMQAPSALRMGLRAGKYGAVGGALGLLAARLFGKSSHNNFKE